MNEQPERVIRLLDLAENDNLSNDEYIRLGRRGSLCVTREVKFFINYIFKIYYNLLFLQRTERAGQGVWYNFETNDSGDMLDLVKQVKHLHNNTELHDFIVRDILPQLSKTSPEESVSRGDDKGQDHEDRNSESRVKVEAYVSKIISELRPIRGTIAEKYLRDVRKIRRLPHDHHNSLRYHPRLSTRSRDGVTWLNNVPGLVALASHPATTTGNLQITYLDHLTADKHAHAEVSRRSLGSFTSNSGPDSHNNISN